MIKNLLRLNFLIFEKFEKSLKGIKYSIILGVIIPIGILLTNGMIFRTLGIIIGVIVIILMGLWTFNIGKEIEKEENGIGY